MVGRIHSIETFGTVDGPGIRFVVFMQGCTLKCKYCHNRDTWEIHGGKETTVEELVKEILKYKSYMDNSGGGVTISGGEPLLQAEFITELFKILKEKGIHTVIDTAGSIPISNSIKELLKYTDLAIVDVKQINSDKAKELTGFSNENNIAFIKYLNNINLPIWIRQVLVPGYTDDRFDLEKLKSFIDSLSNVEKVEILPYHNLGKYKWEEIEGKYDLENVIPPSQEDVEKAKKILNIN